MRSFFRSAWVSRTLPWAAALVLLAGIVTFGTVRWLGTDSTAAPGATASAPTLTTDGTDFTPTTTPAPNAGDVPKEARVTAAEFILTAVERGDLARAWKLTHPDLKRACACTYAEWLTGNIPVQYYPGDAVANAAFEVVEIEPDRILLGVLLTPKAGATVEQTAFFIGLKPVGTGSDRRWLVDTWVPDARPPVPQGP